MTRKELLLNGVELSLKVEGRFTNLRVYLSKEQTPMFRLDKYNNYSIPLSVSDLHYLEKPNTIVEKLANNYGFSGATKKDLDDILTIIEPMTDRKCKEW